MFGPNPFGFAACNCQRSPLHSPSPTYSPQSPSPSPFHGSGYSRAVYRHHIHRVFEELEAIRDRFKTSEQYLVHALEEVVYEKFFSASAQRAELYCRIDWSARKAVFTDTDLGLSQAMVQQLSRPSVVKAIEVWGGEAEFTQNEQGTYSLRLAVSF